MSGAARAEAGQSEGDRMSPDADLIAIDPVAGTSAC